MFMRNSWSVLIAINSVLLKLIVNPHSLYALLGKLHHQTKLCNCLEENIKSEEQRYYELLT